MVLKLKLNFLHSRISFSSINWIQEKNIFLDLNIPFDNIEYLALLIHLDLFSPYYFHFKNVNITYCHPCTINNIMKFRKNYKFPWFSNLKFSQIFAPLFYLLCWFSRNESFQRSRSLWIISLYSLLKRTNYSFYWKIYLFMISSSQI